MPTKTKCQQATKSFARRVRVQPVDCDSAVIGVVHAELAERMCADGRAARVDHRCIRLRESAGRPDKKPSQITLAMLTGTRYTRRETISTERGVVHTQTLKRIDSRDWALFRMAQIDCGAVVRVA